jgi:hypothetical protein
MKAHTKGFKDNISLYGRKLDTKILYEINGVQKVLDGDKIENVNIITNTDLLKTVMKRVEFQSKTKVPKGTIINIKNGVKVDDEFEYIDFGNFIVYDSYWNVDINSYSHICHDNMLKIMIDYSELNIKYPIKLREYINEIAKKCGLEFANINDEFVNYNVDITKDNFNNGNYTFRDVLDYVCELIGGWIVIDENDKLSIKYPTENEEIYYNKQMGNSIIIDNKDNNKKVVDYRIFGDSLQNKTSGKNLLDYITGFRTSINGTINTLNKDGTITVTGIPTSDYTQIVSQYDITNELEDGESYRLSMTNNQDYVWFELIGRQNGTNKKYYTSREYTGSQNVCIVDKTTYDSYVVKVITSNKATWGTSSRTISNKFQLEKGKDKTEFEVFTNGASPNPSYPQEIVSVGDKTKNLFDKDNYNIANVYVSNSNIITSAGATGGSFYIECKPNTEYIINKSNSGTNNRFCVFTTEQVPTIGNKVIDVVGTKQGEDNSTSYTIKTSNNARYLGVFAWVGTTTPTYQEIANTLEIKENYEGYRIPINIKSENLYVNDNKKYEFTTDIASWRFIDGSTKASGSNIKNNTIYKASIVKGKTYKFIVNINSSESIISQLVYDDEISIRRLDGNNIKFNETFTSTKNGYVILRCYINANISVSIDNIMLLETSITPQKYIPYYNKTINIFLNEPLRKIGKYQDYIDFKNKKVVRNVKKILLNKAIGWATSSYEAEKRIYTSKNNIDSLMIGVSTNNDIGLLMSEQYSAVSLKDILDLKVKYGIGISASGYLSIVNPNFDRGIDFLNYLENNPIDLCYATSTPIEETIELPNIELSNIDNIITVDTLLKPSLEIEYKTQEGIPTFNGDFLKDYNINFNKKYGAINSVVFSRGLGNDNIYRKDDNSINSIGLHEIKIENNPFLDGDDRENFIQGVYDKLKGLEFYVMDVDSTGITYLDVGDYYKFDLNKKNGLKSGTVKSGIAKAQTTDSGVYKCLLLNNEILINDGLSERLYTDEPEDTYTNYKISAPTDKSVKNAIIQVDKNKGEIVLKTNSEGKIVQVRLDADADTGSVFNVDADNINLTANDIINLIAGNSINLTSKNITIDSTNFKVDKNGNMKAVDGEFEGKITSTEGEIGGFDINTNTFEKDINGIYQYDMFDAIACLGVYLGTLSNSKTALKILDANNDKKIDLFDATLIQNIINKTQGNTKTASGKFVINSNNPKYCAYVIDDENNIVASMGLGGINSNIISCYDFACSNANDTNTRVNINGSTGSVYASGTVTQGSKKEIKKNFEKLENGLDIIKNTDIYKYHLKTQNNNEKKHIGFVIGDGYNYSQEITSNDNKGVDIYSFVSVCCKAIQEQQEQIEQLKQEIKSLKERIDN